MDARETTPQLARDQAIAAAEAWPFKIIYLFPHPKQDIEEASKFGWYTAGILDTAEPILQTCSLPADLREPHSDLEDVLVHRLSGTIWPHLLPIEVDSLEPALKMLPSPFTVCVTTDAEVAKRADVILAEHPVPVLHISSIAGQGRRPPQSLDLESVCAHLRIVVDALALQPGSERLARECRRVMSEGPRRRLRKHPLPLGQHNVTAPNEIALSAFGYKFLRARPISKPFGIFEDSSSQTYVDRICESADAVMIERSRLLTGFPRQLEDHRVIIAVASSYARLYSTWRNLGQRVPEKNRQDLRRALAMVYRSSSYFHKLHTDENGKPAIGPIGKFVSHELSRDMRAFTSALSMLSSATLCPVLRLEPKINEIRGDAAELARCVRARAGPHYRWKQSRMMHQLGRRMRSLVNQEFLRRVDRQEMGRIEGIKLVTDLPLELMPSNGLPLGLRFDASRVSPVPGNLFWQICNLAPVRIQADDFYDVLIVRSFNNADPIRNHLEMALGVVDHPGRIRRVKYRIVDVQTQDQFVAAVNNFRGAVMIFDGHGRYDAALGVSHLVVGGTSLDSWALKRKCQLPPVVMFSACDTQPIDGNHGSVATSAFALGARAVLGTMFPVDSVQSSIMMARMLLRIDQFLPVAATSLFPVFTWRHVVSGMLRMSHIVEAGLALNAQAQLGLDSEAMARIQLEGNIKINSWSPDWFDSWIASIARESSRSSDDIRTLLDQHVGITDAMKYVQLGNPERVIIAPPGS